MADLKTINLNNVPTLVGDSGSGGTKGLVPAPASGDAAAEKFLKADGTWVTVSTTPADGSVTNAKVAAAAAIDLNKLAATTVSRALVSDGSGFVAAATTTATEIGFVNGVTSAIQTQINNRESINYIVANPNAEIDTTGYATYKDAAQATPVDGTGGSPTLTFTRSTSSPIRGVASFVITTTAANLQGEGASYAFTVPVADQAKPINISFDYKISSGTYADGDMAVYIYDVTNSTVIQPAGFTILNVSGSNRQIATFQTSSSGTSYRLIFHRTVTTSSAMTMQIDNVIVGPQTVSTGAAISDPVSYAASYTGFGTIAASVVSKTRRGNMILINFTFTMGTGTAVQAKISLGATIDFTILTGVKTVGKWGADATPFAGSMLAYNADPTVLYFENNAASFSGTLNGNAWAAGTTISGWAEVPVLGLSSNNVMSADTDTRVVDASVRRASSGQAISTSATKVQWNAKNIDSHGTFDSVTNFRYTVPVPGVYSFTGALSYPATASVTGGSAILYKNGSVYRTSFGLGSASINFSIPFAFDDTAIAGDYYEIYGAMTGASASLLSDASINGGSQWDIKRLSGPTTIAVSEAVNARYYASATSISGSLATVSWTTRDFDSHSGMSSGTYTVPTAGKYQVNAGLLVAGTIALNTTCIMELQKNGTVVSRNTEYAGGAMTNQKGWIDDIISCVAGDTLRIQISSSATLPTIVSSNFDNYISLAKVGL